MRMFGFLKRGDGSQLPGGRASPIHVSGGAEGAAGLEKVKQMHLKRKWAQLKNKEEEEWGEATEENPESCFRGVAERERERDGIRACHQRGEEAAPSPAAPLLSH